MILGISLAGLQPVRAQASKKAEAESAKFKDIRLRIDTLDRNKKPKGSIEIVLYPSKAPELVANFVNLARRGFYVQLYFHKKKHFMIQAGCPTGNGSGNAGYHLDDSIHESLKHDGPGVISMANIGPNTNSSQFCIMTKAAPWLDGKSSIIGKVVKGMDVVEGLQVGDRIEGIKVQDSVKELYRHQRENIKKWNNILDAKREKDAQREKERDAERGK